MKRSFIVILMLLASLGVAQENKIIYRNLKQSSFDWDNLNVDKFLSFKDWKNQTDDKAQVENWEKFLRERKNKEIVGRFFQCHGACVIDRGESFFNPSFRSSIYEGDEVRTIGESYAWIFLFDGTMVRLAPDTSITFNEFNIGASENFFYSRINTGNVLWLSRKRDLFELDNQRETDILFFPLSVYEAQPVPDKKKYKEDDLIELFAEKKSVLKQYYALNSFIEKNNKMLLEKPSFAFLVTPNATFYGKNPSLEIVSVLSGPTYVKKRSSKTLGLNKEARDDEISVQLRGFENKDILNLESDKWMAIDSKGRSIEEEKERVYWLLMGEFLTKRIPSLMLAREYMIERYSAFCFADPKEQLKVANQNGYRFWESMTPESGKSSDLAQRLEFLKEYTRRSETYNLLSATKFMERAKERGEKVNASTFSNNYFIKALNKYYSYEEFKEDELDAPPLNSTNKTVWKRMYGIR